MRSSVLLTLASGLLTYALPTAPNTSLNAVNATSQWTPVLPYPAGYIAATCPVVPGPNPYSTLQVPKNIAGPNPDSTLGVTGRKKRSLTTPTHLRRRNEICRLIFHGNLNHFAMRIKVTQEVLLLAGVTYVFSWVLNSSIAGVLAERNNPDGTITPIQYTRMNPPRGGMTLNNDQTAGVRFVLGFPYNRSSYDISGEYALYQIGPG